MASAKEKAVNIIGIENGISEKPPPVATAALKAESEFERPTLTTVTSERSRTRAKLTTKVPMYLP